MINTYKQIHRQLISGSARYARNVAATATTGSCLHLMNAKNNEAYETD
jgi:hypothetical protein